MNFLSISTRTLDFVIATLNIKSLVNLKYMELSMLFNFVLAI